MDLQNDKSRHVLEFFLIVIVMGMTTLFYTMGESRLVAMNLFFLPVILSGYFLGRTSAGVLALLSALSVTVAMTISRSGFAAYSTPLLAGLVLAVWAAVLGLAAILVGTLCDERGRTLIELHKAYVGVVEVLSRYLQSADPVVKARSIRIAELSQSVAQDMRLSRKSIDDVRVAALLQDVENVEITTQVISNAVNTLKSDRRAELKHTFCGTDLVTSLGTVLEGALPLLVGQDAAVQDCLSAHREFQRREVPLGARIIATVRAYDLLTHSEAGRPASLPEQAILELRRDAAGSSHDVINALERVVHRPGSVARHAPRP